MNPPDDTGGKASGRTAPLLAHPHSEEESVLWLSVAETAARLGVSARAVQKRCAAGTLRARRVAGIRSEIWEVETSALSDLLSANLTTNRESFRANPSANREPFKANQKRELDGEPRTNQSERERELKDEIRFLRGIVESDRRDMAEIRAALREALKLAPKQLWASSSATADGSASAVPQRSQDGVAGYEESSPLNGFTTDQKRAEKPLSVPPQAGLTYGDIADWLEKELNQ